MLGFSFKQIAAIAAISIVSVAIAKRVPFTASYL